MEILKSKLKKDIVVHHYYGFPIVNFTFLIPSVV